MYEISMSQILTSGRYYSLGLSYAELLVQWVEPIIRSHVKHPKREKPSLQIPIETVITAVVVGLFIRPVTVAPNNHSIT